MTRALFGPSQDHYWAKTKEKMHSLGKGILLLQFGGSNEDTLSSNENKFKENLRNYIDEAKVLNFTSIFITDIEKRIKNDDGSLQKSRGNFPRWMKEVAKEEGIRVLDLNQKSFEEYSKLSTSEWKDKFSNCYGRWNKKWEDTHFEPKGAKIIASWIKELACEKPNSTLCKEFK